MEKSKIELILIFFIFILIFALINQKMAYKVSQKNFFSDFHENFHIPYFFVWMPGVFIEKSNFLEGYLIERSVYLQIRNIVDIAFFFDTRQAIEKTTNLHYNLLICFILCHIYFFIGILFIRRRNEWIYDITFIN